MGGSTRCREWKATVTSAFQRLVQVDSERLEHDARVTSKLEVIQHAHHVTLTVGVGTRQKTQHSNFVERLSSESVFTAHDLQCHPTTGLVIERTDYLAETAATEYFKHLVATNTSSTHARSKMIATFIHCKLNFSVAAGSLLSMCPNISGIFFGSI